MAKLHHIFGRKMTDWQQLYQTAVKIATQAHQGQTRWDPTIPYITHPLAVAERFDVGPLKIVAVLHDVLEDTDISEENLRAIFPAEIVDALAIMNHGDETYADYILKVKTNYLAQQVKLADIDDNLRGLEGKKHKQRREKYQLARTLLLL